ncbi:MAG: alpha/beta hydrolase, partial [Vicinamibacteria bacterium]
MALVFALVSSRALAQQPLDGHWEGAISIMGADLQIGVDFATSKEVLGGTIDIPKQGAAGLKLSAVRHEASKVHFELPAGPGLAVFDGELKDGEISGSFLQAGMAGTFHLKRGQSGKPAPPPEPPVPYAQEEVKFKNGDVTIAGTLTLPPSGGPQPAVVMITGSGAQNRDEELFGFKPFRLIADHLARSGIAVLRTDDRGVGGSTGASDHVTTEDFVGDTLAAVTFLKSRPEIDPKRIGLCGHSEGGIVAPMAASRAKDVAFIVLMSGSSVTGEKILLAQAELIGRASGATEADVRKEADLQKRLFKATRSGEGWDELKVEIRKEVIARLEKLPPEKRKGIAAPAQYADSYVDGQMRAAKSPWLKFFLDYDPASALEKVQCPVLALFGEKDLQVPA